MEQSEKDFQAEVIKLAIKEGWPKEFIYHTYDSRRSRGGFPDLQMIRDDRLIVAELKKDSIPDDKIPEDQAAWLEAYSKVTVMSTHLWRPRDMEDIVRRLAR